MPLKCNYKIKKRPGRKPKPRRKQRKQGKYRSFSRQG